MAEANEPKTRDYTQAAQSLASALSTEEPETAEEPKVETQPDPQPEPEPQKQESSPPPKDTEADNAERTRLGRRVKKLEELIGELVTELKESRKQPEPQQFVPETIATAEDVLKVVEVRDQQKQAVQRQYHDNYRKAIDALGEENSDVHEDVIKEIITPNSPFNQILSDNPYADAERNYYRAVKAVLKKRVATPVKPKLPIRGEKPISPTGVPVSTTVSNPSAPAPKIDEYARDFMKRMGMSDKSVKEALG